MLTVDNHKQITDTLVKQGVLTQLELADAKKRAQEASKPLLAYLVDEKLLTEEQLTKITADVNNIPYVNLTEATIDQAVLRLLPKDIAERYMAVPLGYMKERLAVAMLDVNNVQAADFLSTKIGRPISVYAASESGIHSVLSQYSDEVQQDVSDAISGLTEEIEGEKSVKKKTKKTEKSDENSEIKTIVQDSPISRALSTMLKYAATNDASDIHIEPREESLTVRIRVDGILRQVMTLPKSIEPALISRIKILSNLKIDEHRIPQDGQFQINEQGRDIDLRISISPVIWGEQVVIRLLDKSGQNLHLEDMGFRGHSLRAIREGIHKPHGMILSSGPTGSGKSTTLYALINEIKSDEINIVTLEDPVEYKMDGINQIQVNSEVGLTFAGGLRSILRQDPDVVMVGEIRDEETASLAVQAALTGHLVLSTLHTNSAAGVLPRLLDMNIEPYLIASTVNTVIGQRLVRRIGDEKVERNATDAEKKSIETTLKGILPAKKDAKHEETAKDLGYSFLPTADQSAYTLYDGKDTKSTPGGFKGRVGIYEAFSVSPAIEQLLLNNSTSSQIQAQAQKEGMLTMKQDGYLKALNGATTLAEVGRVAADS